MTEPSDDLCFFEIGRRDVSFEVGGQEFDPAVARIRPVADIELEGHVGPSIEPQGRRPQMVRTAQSQPQFSVVGARCRSDLPSAAITARLSSAYLSNICII